MLKYAPINRLRGERVHVLANLANEPVSSSRQDSRRRGPPKSLRECMQKSREVGWGGKVGKTNELSRARHKTA